MGDPRPAVRSESARSLGHYGPDAAPAVDPLAAALTDEYLDVRLSAAEALAHLGPTARPAVPALRQAAKSTNELLRDTARQAISRIE